MIISQVSGLMRLANYPSTIATHFLNLPHASIMTNATGPRIFRPALNSLICAVFTQKNHVITEKTYVLNFLANRIGIWEKEKCRSMTDSEKSEKFKIPFNYYDNDTDVHVEISYSPIVNVPIDRKHSLLLESFGILLIFLFWV